MGYLEKSTQLACESSVAVLVLMGAPEDVEFIPIRPRPADEKTLADIKARWPGHGLRSVGIVGLVGTSPRCVLKELLEPEQVSSLGDAFCAYIHALFSDNFAAQQDAVEIQELNRLWSLTDPRPN